MKARIFRHASGRRIASLLPVVLLVGCASEPAGDGTPTVRDSAGVEIVENSGPRWRDGQGWRLSAEPLLDIGDPADGPQHELFRVLNAVRLSDGRVVVANSGSAELRFYSPTGEFLTASGGQGGGPGEFQGLTYLTATVHDSLIAFDRLNRRISVFDPEGRLARSFLAEPLSEPDPFPLYILASSDGSLVMGLERPLAGGEQGTGVYREAISFVRCDRDGALIDTLARLPGTEWYVRARSSEHASTAAASPRIFGRVSRATGHADGFFFGTSDSYEIGYYGSDGDLQRLIRREEPNLPLTHEDIDRYKNEQLARTSDERVARYLEVTFAEMPFPETMPAYTAIYSDPDGNLWVADSQKPGAPTPLLTIFDRGGVMLGSLELPPRFSVYEIGSDYVLGHGTDELGVEYVQLYGLIKD